MNKKGKSIGNLLNIKKSFFENNQQELKKRDEEAKILKLQPKRQSCKICHKELPKKMLFSSHGIKYYLCDFCNHLNSEYEDNDDFVNQIYLENDYEKNYTESDYIKYNERVDEIYKPKAEFLLTCLGKQNNQIPMSEIDVLDIGAGSGYFVKALRDFEIRANGVEISKKQVNFANEMTKQKLLMQISKEELCHVIGNSKCNVLSAIGVLEHLYNLDEVLDTITKNQNIKYIFFSVPMFSFSALFEAANQNCFNRHLGGGHTHLFSDKSIEYISNKIGFEVEDTWKFGSDIMDLYRFICVNLETNGNKDAVEFFSKKFVPLIDKLQLVVDESEFASEIHVFLKRKAQ